MISICLAILFTFWLSSDVVFLVVARILRGHRLDVHGIFVLTRGMGPIAISWLMYHAYFLWPGHHRVSYMAGVLILSAAGAWWGRGEIGQLRTSYQRAWDACRGSIATGSSGRPWLIVALVALAFVFLMGIAFPIVSHDALVFTTEARIIYRDVNLDHYPAVAADPKTGFYCATFQVPCLQMLYVWLLHFAPPGNDLLLRMVAPLFSLHTLLLVGWLLFRRTGDQVMTALGCAILAVTPMFVTQGYFNSQDPHRLYYALVAVVCVSEAIRTPSWPLVAVTGAALGAATFAHLAGVVAAGMGIALFIGLSKVEWTKRVGMAAAMSVAFLLAASMHHYLRPATQVYLSRQFTSFPTSKATAQRSASNREPRARHEDAARPPRSSAEELARTGPASRSLVSAASAESESASESKLTALRGQTSQATRLALGHLQIFSRADQFGLLYVFAAAGAVIWWKSSERQTIDVVMLAMILVYIVAVASGVRKLSWSNYRYWGSTLPMAAYFATFAAGAAYYRIKHVESAARRRLALATLFIAMLTPLILVTGIRGAKVDGVVDRSRLRTFYNFQWINDLRREPVDTMRRIDARWLGIRSTLANLSANDEKKRADAHETFAAIEFINDRLPEDALVLVHRAPRYFYYARRRGVACNDPRLGGQPRNTTPNQTLARLRSMGVQYVLADQDYFFHTSTVMRRFIDDLEAHHEAARIYDHRGTRIYALEDVERVVAERATHSDDAEWMR